MCKLQLLCKGSRKVSIMAWPLLQVAENSPRIRRLESQVAREEAERAAAFFAADASKQELNSLQAQDVELYFGVKRLHCDDGAVKRLRAGAASICRNVEKMVASLTVIANIRGETVRAAKIVSVQLAASDRREHAKSRN